MSYMPEKGSLRDQIALCIYKNGQMSAAEIVEAFAEHKRSTVSGVLNYLKRRNGLTHKKGVYALTEELHACYSGSPLPPKPEVHLAMRPWKPLSAKHIPSLEPRRADAGPVHDVGYINGSAGVNDVFRGCIK